MKIYTIKDIAALAGVGISTVSRVLNHRPDVSEATRKRVMDVVETYNYTQNANAKNLKQRNNNLVSLIVRGRRNTFLNDVAEHIIETGNDTGQDFLLDFIDETGDELEAAHRHIAEKKVKGIVFLGANIVGRAQEIAALRIPCVFSTIDARSLALPSVSSISVDNRRSAMCAVDYLLARGHRRIAVFGGRREVDDSIGERYLGILDGYAKLSLSFDESLYVQCPFDMEKAYEAAEALIKRRAVFTAVFAMSDTMAIGIIKALHDQGLRVPENISVIGFDGIPLSRFMLPTLTTIAQPVRALAEGSVSLMLRLLKNGQDAAHMTLHSVLVAGNSVASLPGGLGT